MSASLVAVSLENWTWESEGLLALMSEREIKALRLYGSKQELAASLVGFTLAKSLIRFRYHTEGELVRCPGGKPCLNASDWKGDFSVSHSSGLVVVAICPDGPIGVDVERVRPVMEEMIPECLSPGERRAWRDAGTDEDRRAMFFRFWTLKEAYLKYTGGSIGEASLRELDFSGSRPGGEGPDSPAGSLSVPAWIGSGGGHTPRMAHHSLEGGYSLAVCGAQSCEAPEWLTLPKLAPRKPREAGKRFSAGSVFRKVPGLWSSFFS